MKSMAENRGNVALEPTPNFDGHIAKMANVDLAATAPTYAFDSSQVLIYF